MIVQNPLVPTPPSAAGGAASPVANAPAATEPTRSETARPVTPSEGGERSSLGERNRAEAANEQQGSAPSRSSDAADSASREQAREAADSNSGSARFAAGEGRGQKVDIFA